MNVQRAGGTVVVMEHFDAEESLRLIEEHRVTFGQFVPTMFVRMLKLPSDVRDRYDVSSMQVAVHAAAPWTGDIFGGRQSARSAHFLGTLILVLFFTAHMVMLLLSQPLRRLRTMTLGRRGDPS
jgi:acyl-CoA synthetase (AMP-forming)/AMP-acid ligase II